MRKGPQVSRVVAVSILLAMMTACLKPPSIIEPDSHSLFRRSRILASDGSVLATLFVENRENVKLSEVPKNMLDAVIAIEDRRFFKHKGFDIKAIGRAALANLSAHTTVQGGSTITQQYVKNIYFPVKRPRSFTQKIKEAELAWKVEQEFSKKQILEKYLNTVYFGNGAYGVKAAAEHYFRKPISEVDLNQAAMLAGIIKAPETYNPRRNQDAAVSRRNLVLDAMSREKMIAPADAAAIKAQPLGITEPPAQPVREPYWVDYVKHYVTSNPLFGQDEGERAAYLFQSGADFHTSLDLNLQQYATTAIRSILNKPGDPEAALVALDPRTGKVLAMAGGRDYSQSQVNLALGANGGGSGRQPGSAFKPFVLAAAFEDGIRSTNTFSSTPPVVPLGPGTPPWRPKNSEGRGGGLITIRDATAFSVNAVFVRLGMTIGFSRIAGMASRMGIESPMGHRLADGTIQVHPSIALGAVQVSPLEMASAFGTLADYGVHISPSPLLNVDDPDQGIITPSDRTNRVLDPGIAWLITDTLTDVINRGTGTKAQIGRPAAGKTGTTSDYVDAWFVGYTPDLVTAVWVGYPQGNIPMRNVHGIRVFGGTFPAMIWRRFMQDALAGKPALNFDLPASDLITVNIDPATGLLAGPYCSGSQSVEMLRQLAPTETCQSPSPGPTSTATNTVTSSATPSQESSP